MSTETQTKQDSITDGNVSEVLARVDNDPRKALRAYREERNGKARKTLLDQLKNEVIATASMPAWARKQQVGPSGARFQMAKSTLELFQATEAYQSVKAIIEAGDHRERGVRLDNGETELKKLSDALFSGADEVFEQSVADFKTLLRSSRIAASQAKAAADYEPPVEAEEVPTAEEAEDAEADEITDEVTA